MSDEIDEIFKYTSINIALAVASKLNEEIKQSGADTFTIGDVRRVKREMFEGKREVFEDKEATYIIYTNKIDVVQEKAFKRLDFPDE